MIELSLSTFCHAISVLMVVYVLVWSWLQTFNANPEQGFFKVWGQLAVYYLAYTMPWWFVLVVILLVTHAVALPVGLVCLGAIALYVYASLVVPNCLKVAEQTIDMGLAEPLKVAVISDLHMGMFSGKPRHIRRLVRTLNAQSVDAILVAGDWLYYPGADLVGQMLLLKSIDKPVYTVMGNADYAHRPVNSGQPLLEDSLDSALVALDIVDITHQCVELPQVRLVGWQKIMPHSKKAQAGLQRDARLNSGALNNKALNNRDLNNSTLNNEALSSRLGSEVKSSNKPVIVLAHQPQCVSEIPEVPQSRPLLIAGHTHGGQIKLPKVGGYWTFRKNPTGYLKGLYQHRNAQVFVSSGLGMTCLPFRLGVPPVIDVLTIR